MFQMVKNLDHSGIEPNLYSRLPWNSIGDVVKRRAPWSTCGSPALSWNHFGRLSTTFAPEYTSAQFLHHAPTLSGYKTFLAMHMVNSARLYTPTLWKSICAPSLPEWFALINKTCDMEELMHEACASSAKFYEISAWRLNFCTTSEYDKLMAQLPWFTNGALDSGLVHTIFETPLGFLEGALPDSVPMWTKNPLCPPFFSFPIPSLAKHPTLIVPLSSSHLLNPNQITFPSPFPMFFYFTPYPLSYLVVILPFPYCSPSHSIFT